jgi:hypothetical protein
MIALLRKDRPWMRACIVGGVAVMTVALMNEDLRETWILPPTKMTTLFAVGWIWGLTLGFAASVRDERLGTRDLLDHRPVSRRELHASRVLACGVVLANWSVLPSLLRLGIAALVDEQAGAIRRELITYVWLGLLPCVSACAIALFAGTLPFRLRWRIAISLVLLYSLFGLIGWCAEPRSNEEQAAIESSRWIFASLHCAIALAFVLASFAICGSRRDVDRPWPSRLRLVGVGSTVLAVAIALTFAAHALEGRQSVRLHKQYPKVVRMTTGELALMRINSRPIGPHERWSDIVEFVDEEHRPVALADRELERSIAAPRSTWLSLPTLSPPRLHWRDGSTFFKDGQYYALRLDPRLGRFVFRSFGKGAEQSPFAADAERVSANYPFSGPVHLIYEPSSRSLWKLEWDVGYFQPLALPNGDSMVAVLRTNSRPQFLGLEGEYEYVGDQFRWIRARERSAVIASPEAPPTPLLRAQTDADLLSPRLQIFDAAGSLIFEHAYAPRTSSERWSAGGVIAWSFARPPALSVSAHLGAAPMETENALIDPLVSGGRRTWLVALHLLFGALCAALALWRLRRLGADRRAQWFWGVLTLLLGFAPLLASLCFERRRAWSRGPAIESSTPPRIVTKPSVVAVPARA